MDAARVVCFCGQAGARDAAGVRGCCFLAGGDGGGLDEGVVVDGAGDEAAAEAGTDFKGFCCWDGEHGVGELCF